MGRGGRSGDQEGQIKKAERGEEKPCCKVDVVVNWLLGTLYLGCCESPVKTLNRPLPT